MALSGTFGTYRPEQPVAVVPSGKNVPWVYTLTVLVSAGGFAKQVVIASATDKEDLKDFLDHWIARNRHAYAGKYLIDYVPFVSETEDDA